MGPKKAAGGKKKEGNPENGGELDDAKMLSMYKYTVNSLQIQLGDKETVLSGYSF